MLSFAKQQGEKRNLGNILGYHFQVQRKRFKVQMQSIIKL